MCLEARERRRGRGQRIRNVVVKQFYQSAVSPSHCAWCLAVLLKMQRDWREQFL